TVFLSVGVVLKLVVLWIGGKALEDEIRSVLDAIDDYQWYIVGGLFAISFLQSFGKVRRGLPEIVDEIETPDGIVVEHRHHPDGPGAAPGAPSTGHGG